MNLIKWYRENKGKMKLIDVWDIKDIEEFENKKD